MNPAPNQNAEAIYGLSPTQAGMLFHSVSEEHGTYTGQMSCTIRGTLDLGCFRKAWQDLVDCHAVLRTSFVWRDLDRPLQVVHRSAPVTIAVEDLRGLLSEQRTERVQRFLSENRRLPFDLMTPPLFRLNLFHTGEDESVFVWTRHHILLDGWSVNLLLRELSLRYEAALNGTAPESQRSRPYRIYIDWLRKHDNEASRRFWRSELSGFDAPCEIDSGPPMRRGASPIASLAEEKLTIPEDLNLAVGDAARRLAVTEAAILTGSWSLVVSRYCSTEDVLFGLTLSGRPAELPGSDSMIGLFLNTLPARFQVLPSAKVSTWLKDIHSKLALIAQHQYTPATEMRSYASVGSDVELFSHILSLESYPADGTAENAGPRALKIQDYQFIDQTNFPLNVGVISGEERILLGVYDPDRFDPLFVHSLMADYISSVRWLIQADDHRVGECDVLHAGVRQWLVERCNRTKVKWHREGDLVTRICKNLKAGGDHDAVRFNGASLSFAGLDAASDALASRLAALGCGAETVVAVVMERSFELVIALVAILKAGAAYLPLDPDDPPARIDLLLHDSGARAVVTSPHSSQEWLAAGLPILLPELHQSAAFEMPEQIAGSQAAYVIYTSGSTGRPKPVINTRDGLLNRLLWMQSAYPLDASSRVLQKTPYTFDVSVWEFFWPLLTGATLVLAEPGGHRDAAYIRDLIIFEKITTVHFVPSMLALFLNEEGIERCTSLEHVICSGEALPHDLVSCFFRRSSAALHNLYGPTEAAIDVTSFDCAPGNVIGGIPIGKPIANTQIFVLSSSLHLVPPGAVGEIFIAGNGLARGYSGQPDRTAERFVPNPYFSSPGARMYRTGDLGKIDRDGNIHYLGRTDFQIKLRGVRVEPGEIESALKRLPGIRGCAVLAERSAAGDTRLVAHVVPNQTLSDPEKTEFGTDVLRALRQQLPAVMVPASIVFHDEFPLSANGKLDREALRRKHSDTLRTATGPSDDLPQTEVERDVAAIWKEVLSIGQIGVRDNFFELGGHSLLLNAVSGRIQRKFGVAVPLRVLFNAQTVSAMAEAVLDAQLAAEDPVELGKLAAEIRGLPPEEVSRLLGAG